MKRSKALAIALLCFAQPVPFPGYKVYGKEQELESRGSPHIIAMFLKPAAMYHLENPHTTNPEDVRALTDIDKFIRSIIEHQSEGRLGGLYATYEGFVDTFDENDELMFPRKHAEDEITLVVSRSILPVIIKGNTVEYFVRQKKAPIAYYQLKRFKDKDTKDFFWKTEKIESPKSSIIPLHAIVLCANPDELIIPEGFTKTFGGPHLILPSIYPTKHIKRTINALSFLKINKYFEPVHLTYKIQQDRYAALMNLF